jgi:hypothetical protein
MTPEILQVLAALSAGNGVPLKEQWCIKVNLRIALKEILECNA